MYSANMPWAFSTASVTRFSGFMRSTPQTFSENDFARFQFRLVERPLKELCRSRPSEVVSRYSTSA
jgi:hypothetical protein